MSGHLDLSASCLCGGELEDVNSCHQPPVRAVVIVRCVECRREWGIEVRMFALGQSGPLGWGEFGSGERPRDVRRAVAA